MGRAPCCEKNGVKKGPWSPEEDHILTHYILKHGHPNWRSLPKAAGLDRCGKSCRLRWTNYLRPDIKRERFSFQEEETIIHLHRLLGNKWSAIAARLPGRTDNEIKNYWNTHIRKRLLRMGIDPVTHAPTLHLLHQLSSLLATSNNPQQGLDYLGSQNALPGSSAGSSPNRSPVQPNTDQFAFGLYCAPPPNEWESDGVILPTSNLTAEEIGEDFFLQPPLPGRDYGGSFPADPPPPAIPDDSRQPFDASALHPNDVVVSEFRFHPAVSFSDDTPTTSSSSGAAALTAGDDIRDIFSFSDNMLNLDGYQSLLEVDELFM